jgi:hypothetical protein
MLGCAQCPVLQNSRDSHMIAETSFAVVRIPVPEEQTHQQCQQRNEMVFRQCAGAGASRSRKTSTQRAVLALCSELSDSVSELLVSKCPLVRFPGDLSLTPCASDHAVTRPLLLSQKQTENNHSRSNI